MEIYAQLISDVPISANWVMAGLLAIAIYWQKRAADKADAREKKIDEILEKQQDQLNEHAGVLQLHEHRLDEHDQEFSKLGQASKDLAEEIIAKIKILKSL